MHEGTAVNKRREKMDYIDDDDRECRKEQLSISARKSQGSDDNDRVRATVNKS